MQKKISYTCCACSRQATRVCFFQLCIHVPFLCSGQCNNQESSAERDYHNHLFFIKLLPLDELIQKFTKYDENIKKFDQINAYIKETAAKIDPPVDPNSITYSKMSPKQTTDVTNFMNAFLNNEAQNLTGQAIHKILDRDNAYQNTLLSDQLVEIGLNKMTKEVEKIKNSMPQFLTKFKKHLEINQLTKTNYGQNQGKQLEAIQLFELAFNYNPFQIISLFYMGLLYHQIKNYEKAVEYIQYYLALNCHKYPYYQKSYDVLTDCSKYFQHCILQPTSKVFFKKLKQKAESQFAKAKKLIVEKSNNFDEIIQLLSSAIDLSECPYQPLVARSTIYNLRRMYKLARQDNNRIVSFQELVKAQDFYSKGMTQLHLSLFQEAIKSFDQGFQMNINPYYYSMRGYCYYELQQYEKAFQDFTLGIPQQPNVRISGLELSIDTKNGAWNPAIKFYTQILKKFQLNDFAYYQRARTCLNMCQNLQNALIDLEIAIKINPNQHRYFSNRALAQQGLNMYQKALETYEISIKMKQDCHQCFTFRAMTYFKMRDYENAVKDLNKSIEMESNNELAYSLRAKTYENMSQFGLAEKDHLKIFELDPTKLGSWEKSKMCKVLNQYVLRTNIKLNQQKVEEDVEQGNSEDYEDHEDEEYEEYEEHEENQLAGVE